jgi:hypothetical protein
MCWDGEESKVGIFRLKARSHGLFSPFGGCEGVDYLIMLLCEFITWNIYNSSTRSHPSEEEHRPKIARVNWPLGGKCHLHRYTYVQIE